MATPERISFRRVEPGVYETPDGRFRVAAGMVGGHARSMGRRVWHITDTHHPDRRFLSSESLDEARYDVADIIRREAGA